MSGLALAIGAAVALVGHLFGGVIPGQRYFGLPWRAAQFAMLVGGELILLGLPAVYRRQSSRLGVFGLIAFVLLFGGLIREVAAPVNHLWTAAVAARPEARGLSQQTGVFVVVILIASQYTVGVIAFGVSVIRARVFSRAAGGLLIAGLVVENLSGVAYRSGLVRPVFEGRLSPDGAVIVFAALGWLGLELASVTGRYCDDGRSASHDDNV